MLTYEQCQEIVKNNENFYEKVEIVNGRKVSVFNYILSVHSFFMMPFPGSPYNALEMRGLTFVHEDGQIKRYLMLDKFFNLNEVAENQYSLLTNKRILRVQDKLDGSMMRFIPFSDGKIVVKTKNGFTNDQCRMATAVYNKDENLQNFVKETLDQGLVAIFELVSPMNKIVVNYKSANLRLIQMRDESTGAYLDIYNHPTVLKHNVSTTEKFPTLTLEQLVSKKETDENVEGWIVTFEDGHKIKVKTNWYMERHRMLDASSKEDEMVKLICEEKIDDAIAILDKDDERRIYVEEMQLFLVHHLKKVQEECVALFNDYKGDKKEFAIKNKNNERFGLVVKHVGQPLDVEKLSKDTKEMVIRNCRRLQMARQYLSKNGFAVKDFIPLDEG